MELFFTDTTSAFFALSSTAIRETLHSHLRSMKLPRLSRFLGKTAEERWQNDDCAARWARGELSNLAYLLRVNRLAGRSYNDLSQYYVMPWVLRDYESAQLDLSDPRVYRDFSLPIGAQKPERRALVQEKFEMMKELRAQQEQQATEDLDLLGALPTAESRSEASETETAPPTAPTGRFRKCYRISREFAASLPDDLLQVCGYSSWQSWHDAALKRLLGEYAARKRATKKEDKTA